MNKRIIAGAAAVVLAAQLFPAARGGETVAYAAGGLVFGLSAAEPVSVGESAATEGTEIVSLSVEIKDNPGVQSWVLLLDYDNNALTYDSFNSDTFNGLMVNANAGHIVINDFELNDNSTKGTALTLNFKVKSGLGVGKYGSFTLSTDTDTENYFNFADDTIEASISGGTADLEVKKVEQLIKVDSLTLDDTAVTLDEGSTFTLKPKILPANATNQNVSYNSSNTSVATVDASGKITAVKAGSAVITVTSSDGGKSATCNVTVNAIPVSGVTLGQKTLELMEGDSSTLTWTVSPANASNKTVSFTSSNVSVAKVTSTGRVTAVKPGDCTITITTEDGSKTDVCSVTVKEKPAVFTVAFADSEIKLKKGDKKTLSFNVTVTQDSPSFNKASFEDVSNWQFTTTDASVATVSAEGIVTAAGVGTAVIKATNPNYVDETDKMITLSIPVTVASESTGVTAKVSAYNAPTGCVITAALFSGSKKVAEKSAASGGTILFGDVADGKYKVLISCNSGDPAFKYAPLAKEIEVKDGTFELNETLYIYGDITKDGITDENDLSRLQQYVSGWKVTIPYFEVANVMSDNEIDTGDISRYQQYLSGWKVTLG